MMVDACGMEMNVLLIGIIILHVCLLKNVMMRNHVMGQMDVEIILIMKNAYQRIQMVMANRMVVIGKDVMMRHVIVMIMIQIIEV